MGVLIFYDMSFKDVHTMICVEGFILQIFYNFFFFSFLGSFGDRSSALCKIVCDRRCRSSFLPTLH